MRRLVLVLALAGCHSASSPPPVGALPASARSRPDVTAASIEAAVHERANRARGDEGLGEVDVDEALAAVARRHSADMAARQYVAHVGPDGRDPNARAAVDGLECRVRVSATRTRVGFLENLYQGGLYSRRHESSSRAGTTVSYDWLTTEALAAQTVDGWLASPTHRVNLLHPGVDREGIGAAITPDGLVYVTQMLC
jgi:uncharacterized protein YkwD